jgi:LacI family transcriptional regulator
MSDVTTIRDVAERAGVSPMTASRVLSGAGYSSSEAREAVQRAAAELGYRPNTIARALVQGATRTVGLVVGDVENPFFATLARVIADALEERGYTLLLTNSDEDPAREARLVDALRGRQVDGLIVAPSAGAGRHLAAAVAGGVSLVQVDRAVRGLAADVVLVDNAHGAEVAVGHLAGLGHARIACVTDPVGLGSSRERVAGYRKAIGAHGLEPLVFQAAGVTQEHGLAASQEALAVRPTALFTASNFMTLGAMRAIREAGLAIPADVALIGFDDLDWTTLVDPPLTVVAQPVAELGRVAAELLLERLDGEMAPPRRVRLRTSLVVRQSCGERQP